MISGGPIENFREAWAILPFIGRHGKPHYWRRADLTNHYRALCGLQGSLATREMLVQRGMPHASSIKPLGPGDFIADRCKLCARKRQRQAVKTAVQQGKGHKV